MNYKFFRATVIILVGVAVLAILLIWDRKHTVPVVVKSPVSIQPVGAGTLITVQPTEVALTNKTALYDVEGSYPQFSQAGADFNKQIASAFTGDVSQFISDSTSDYNERKNTMTAQEFNEYYGGGTPVYTFTLTTNVVQSNANFISVVFHEDEYTGGAHPISNVITYNYDVQNQKEINLSYFYPNDPNYLQEVSDASRAQLTPALETANSEASLDSGSESMLEQGTDPTDPTNFQMFTFTNSTITIYFGEYQVAPYVDGEQTVILPIK